MKPKVELNFVSLTWMCLVCHDDFRLAQATRSRSLKQLRKGNVI